MKFVLACIVALTVGSIAVPAAGAAGAADDLATSPPGTTAAPGTTVVDTSTADTSTGDNPYIPEDVNLGDCISSLPRPGCGTEASTSGKTLATFGILLAAMAFIGWRIVRGVRQREQPKGDRD